MVKGSILKFFDRRLNELLTLLKDHDIPLVVGIERKVRLETLKVTHDTNNAVPVLRFEKTQLGIKYSLKLATGNDRPWSPFQKDVHILANECPWIVSEYELFRLEKINGNKLKPFLKKEVIFIKHEMVYTYFEKFILQVAQQADIEAEGFDVVQHSTIEDCWLTSTFDFVQKELVLDVVFQYRDAVFSHGSQANNKTRISVSEAKEISIIQIKRDLAEEQKWIDKLKSFGKTAIAAFYLRIYLRYAICRWETGDSRCTIHSFAVQCRQ